MGPLSTLHDRGYSGLGKEKVRERRCLKESFDFGHPGDEERRNSWPGEELLSGLSAVHGGFLAGFKRLPVVRGEEVEI